MLGGAENSENAEHCWTMLKTWWTTGEQMLEILGSAGNAENSENAENAGNAENARMLKMSHTCWAGWTCWNVEYLMSGKVYALVTEPGFLRLAFVRSTNKELFGAYARAQFQRIAQFSMKRWTFPDHLCVTQILLGIMEKWSWHVVWNFPRFLRWGLQIFILKKWCIPSKY